MKNNQTDQYKNVGNIQRVEEISHSAYIAYMYLCIILTLSLEREKNFDLFT